MNKAGGKQEIKCGICGKGHLTIKCYKNPNRMQQIAQKKETKQREVTLMQKMKCKGHRLGLIVS